MLAANYQDFRDIVHNSFNPSAPNPLIGPMSQMGIGGGLVSSPVVDVLNPNILYTLAASVTTVGAALKTGIASAKASLIPKIGVAAAVVAVVTLTYAVYQANVFINDSAAAASWAHNLRRNPPENLSDWSVYLIWENTGVQRGGYTPTVWYVGITTNITARERAHRADARFTHLGSSFEMTAITTGLTRETARVQEQALMMAFATLGVTNLINSIAPHRWGETKWQREIQRLNTLLSNI